MSKSPVRIKLNNEGTLNGYHIRDLARTRRDVLAKILRKQGSRYSQVIKRLNVLGIYNKNRHPDITAIVHKDIKYIQRHFGHLAKTKRSPKKSVKRSYKKRSYKKRSYKKRSPKRSYKKKSSKKHSIKRKSSKRSAKRSYKKRSVKRSYKKKRSQKKRSTKRSYKKRSLKK